MNKKETHNDETIVRRVLDGEVEAFRSLVDKYKNPSFSLAVSLLKNREDAEDVCQEAFIKAFQNLKRFQFKASFASWLYRIVYNSSLTFVKQRKMHGTLEEKETMSELHVLNGEQLIASEQSQIINGLLDQLNADEALCMRLYYLAEQSVHEIREVTGFKTSKIKVALHRGRKHMMQAYQHKFGKEVL